MAFLKKWFGTGSGETAPKPRPTAVPHETASERMANTIDTAERKEQVLEKRIADETRKAKEYLAKKNQRGAMACLKKKKLYETQLEQLMNQRFNLEQLQLRATSSSMQADMVAVQREMARELMNNAPKMEDVDRVQDDLTDALDNQRDVGEALAMPMAGGVEDEDVLDELAALEQEQEDDQFMTKVNDMDVKVPSGPIAGGAVKKPVEAEQDEDEDVLAGLTAELNA